MEIYVPALWIAGGICFFAGLQFTILGLLLRQERVFLAFGLLALLFAAYIPFSALGYRATTTDALAGIARVQMGIICVMYPTFVWFVSSFTEKKNVARFLLAISLPFAVLFVINLGSPFSFLYRDIAPAGSTILPWGESISYFRLQVAPIAWLYYAASYTVFAWAIYRGIILWRRGAMPRAIALTTYLVVQLLTVVHGELVDNLNLKSPYSGEFAFLILVMVVTSTLIWELRGRSEALEKSVEELRAETEQRKKYERQLTYLAHHDYLTDLPNRRALSLQLDHIRNACSGTDECGAMLLIDLDNFKMINDSLGHDLGDRLLQMVAKRLESLMPAEFQPIRLGGDEFATLIIKLPAQKNLAAADAIQQATRIQAEIVKPYEIDEHELIVGACIGIAIFDSTVEDLSDILKNADMALYRAKSLGRNSIEVFSPGLKKLADQRLAIAKDMRRAIANGEIGLCFQPQVDTRGRLSGAEVLARWVHAELGEVAPTKFIAIAEETGLVHLLGENILTQACQYLKESQSDGGAALERISVNVSPWQLENPGFTARTIEIVNRCGIDPTAVTFEITESAFMRNIVSVSQTIKELSHFGNAFSIDDFGTGYSALIWLKQLSVHELKIDRRFVVGLSTADTDRLVETILAIARHMDLRVVAEGVETEDQRKALIRLGCSYLQGFLVSPPMSAEEFTAWRCEARSVRA